MAITVSRFGLLGWIVAAFLVIFFLVGGGPGCTGGWKTAATSSTDKITSEVPPPPAEGNTRSAIRQQPPVVVRGEDAPPATTQQEQQEVSPPQATTTTAEARKEDEENVPPPTTTTAATEAPKEEVSPPQATTTTAEARKEDEENVPPPTTTTAATEAPKEEAEKDDGVAKHIPMRVIPDTCEQPVDDLSATIEIPGPLRLDALNASQASFRGYDIVLKLQEFMFKHNVMTVADIPCGLVDWQMGLFSVNNARAYFGGDSSAERIRGVKDRFRQSHRNKIFRRWDLDRCGVPKFSVGGGAPESFDMLITRDALQHVPIKTALKMAEQVVASGVKFWVVTSFPLSAGCANQCVCGEKSSASSASSFFYPNSMSCAPWNFPAPMLSFDAHRLMHHNLRGESLGYEQIHVYNVQSQVAPRMSQLKQDAGLGNEVSAVCSKAGGRNRPSSEECNGVAVGHHIPRGNNLYACPHKPIGWVDPPFGKLSPTRSNIEAVEVRRYDDNGKEDESMVVIHPDQCQASAAGAEAFKRIYDTKMWGVSQQSHTLSGMGSTLNGAFEAVIGLNDFIAQYGIESVADIPSGDIGWQMNIDGVNNARAYFGGDISQTAIGAVHGHYRNVHRNKIFRQWDLSRCPVPRYTIKGETGATPQPFDLLISRDVFQHVPIKTAVKMARNVVASGVRYWAVTSFPDSKQVPQSCTVGGVQHGGEYHDNVELEPWKFPPPTFVFQSHPFGAWECDFTYVYDVRLIEGRIKEMCDGDLLDDDEVTQPPAVPQHLRGTTWKVRERRSSKRKNLW